MLRGSLQFLKEKKEKGHEPLWRAVIQPVSQALSWTAKRPPAGKPLVCGCVRSCLQGAR